MEAQDKTRYRIHAEASLIEVYEVEASSPEEAVRGFDSGELEAEFCDRDDASVVGAVSIFAVDEDDELDGEELGVKTVGGEWKWNLCPHCGSESIVKVSSDGEATPCTTLCEDCHMYSGYADDADEGTPAKPAAPAGRPTVIDGADADDWLHLQINGYDVWHGTRVENDDPAAPRLTDEQHQQIIDLIVAALGLDAHGAAPA